MIENEKSLLRIVETARLLERWIAVLDEAQRRVAALLAALRRIEP